MNALSNQIAIEQICQLLKTKERTAKKKLKDWGVKIYPLNNPYAKNKFVLMADFNPRNDHILKNSLKEDAHYQNSKRSHACFH